MMAAQHQHWQCCSSAIARCHHIHAADAALAPASALLLACNLRVFTCSMW
jgi:hypothetical protein